jgi:hypothetical protein
MTDILNKTSLAFIMLAVTIIFVITLNMNRTLNKIEANHEIITEDDSFSLHYSGKAYDTLDSITLDSMLQVISEDSLHRIEIDKD